MASDQPGRSSREQRDDGPHRGPAPVAAGERIAALDVLRGFALYGVFLVNASVSAAPMDEVLAWPADAGLGERVGWIVLNGLAVTKFVTIFSLLFGVGLVLQTERLAARGAPVGRVYGRRLASLALLGLLHGTLLFEGDILLPYAVAGALLFLARGRSPRWLVGAAAALFAVGFALDAAWASLGPELTSLDDPAWEERAWRARTEGPLSLTLSTRALEYAGWLVISSLDSFNWRVLALFFLGAAAMKRGAFAPGRTWPRRGAAVGLVAGLALEAVGLAASAGVEEPGAPVRLAGALAVGVGSLLLAGGYVSAVTWLVDAGRLPALQRGLAAVGRTALSNYVAQSVLMNLLFYWFGLGLYGELGRLQVLGVVTLLFAGQVAASLAWLRFRPMGPLEALWRRATYGARS